MDVATNGSKIFDLLIQYLCVEHIDYAIELSLQGQCYVCNIYIFMCILYEDHTHSTLKKDRYSSSWEPHLRATGRHLPYGITQCYLPPDTSECAPPNPSHAGRYSIYLPRRDGRLS